MAKWCGDVSDTWYPWQMDENLLETKSTHDATVKTFSDKF